MVISMVHFDHRHPYERFMDRLSRPSAPFHSGSVIARSTPGVSPSDSRFTIHRVRIWLYGTVAVLVLATLIWSGQRSHGIAVANADSLDGTVASFAAARAKALEQSPLSPVTMLKLAAPLIDGSQRGLAVELLTEANRRNPAIRDVQLQLGYALMRDGRLAEAKAALERAKLLDPLYPPTYELLAAVEQALGNAKAATLAAARAEQFALVPALSELK